MNKLKERIFKGESIIELPQNYVVVDIETTGFSTIYSNIIEISALKIEENVIIDKFDTLVALPDENISLDSYIENLTGITTEMLATAPQLKDVIIPFSDFIGVNIIIGHNVSFDINFLYDAFERYALKPLNNNFVNTVRLAKKVFPDRDHYKLSNVADFVGYSQKTKHRALADCETTNFCYQKMREMILRNYENIEDFYSLFSKPKNTFSQKESYSSKTKRIKELFSITEKFINCDNISNQQHLSAWIKNNIDLYDNIEYNKIADCFFKITENKEITDNEKSDIIAELNNIINPLMENKTSINYTDFKEKTFCLSGEFDYGSKESVRDFFINLGACESKNVTKKTDFLIVGNKGNTMWACGNYGTKIKKALELQKQGDKIIIINESDILKNAGE